MKSRLLFVCMAGWLFNCGDVLRPYEHAQANQDGSMDILPGSNHFWEMPPNGWLRGEWLTYPHAFFNVRYRHRCPYNSKSTPEITPYLSLMFSRDAMACPSQTLPSLVMAVSSGPIIFENITYHQQSQTITGWKYIDRPSHRVSDIDAYAEASMHIDHFPKVSFESGPRHSPEPIHGSIHIIFREYSAYSHDPPEAGAVIGHLDGFFIATHCDEEMNHNDCWSE